MLEPTQSQADQSLIAQQDFEELIDRMIHDRFDYRSILAGASAALARSISASAGPKKVPEWFARNAMLTKDWGKD